MTTTNSPPFEFGQTVYVAKAYAYGEERVPCPVCDGKLFATLILGTGEVVPVECEACGLGFAGPQGYIMARKPVSSVSPVVVTGLSRDGAEWLVHTNYSVYRDDVFATEAEAEARRVELHQEAERQATQQNENSMRPKRKKLTWSAYYHRNQIKDLRRQVEWHESKLREIPAKKGGAP